MSEVRDERKLPYQIHSEMDDFGLDPYQFRVYCRVVRRAHKGKCFESVSNMAEGCKMSNGKVKECLRWLVDHGFITRESRQGQSSIYRLNDISKWVQPSHVATQVPGHVATQVESNPGCEMAKVGHVATQVPGHVVATKDLNKGLKKGEKEDRPSFVSAQQVVSVDERHPTLLTEKRFQSGGQSDLPWVVSMANRYNPEYDPEMIEAVIAHLRTTPSFEKLTPQVSDAKQWLSVCNCPTDTRYDKRMMSAYIIWESAQNLKRRKAAQQPQQSEAERQAILTHLYRNWGGLPA